MSAAGVENNLLGGGHEERITLLLLFSCMVAASGGLLFGYEHGISGGVTSMESFLKKFFPGVYAEMKQDSTTSNYCKFNSQILTLFTSSLYISGFFASLVASHATTRFGRLFSMRVGGAFVFTGAAIGGAAINVYMLILSRILLGFGVGFTIQSVSVYLSETAPARYRGAIFNIYDICLTTAVLIANIVNYGSQKIEAGWGWRISLGAAALPAAFLSVGAFFIPETPTSIIQRGGDINEASKVLQRLRGTSNVGKELEQLIAAAAEAPTSTTTGLRPLLRIFRRNYRPQLVIGISLPIFQQLAGINLIGVYAPVMFRTIGLKESASLLSALVTRLTATASNLVATPLIDRLGRRNFFFIGGLELFVSLVTAGSIMATHLGDHGTMQSQYAQILLFVFCVFISGFSWSWGPLPILVPSEIFPLEVRSAGRSIGVALGLLFTAAMSQMMLFLLCYLKWGIFFFFGGWMFLITMFVFFFLPETKGLKLEEMDQLWKQHWYWKKFVNDEPENERLLSGAASFEPIK
ncbi:hexose carrier protein HEX6 [Dendrobium catenatum]|uniref:Hexose carrier protein HEX6 n=1 Tax=Dendrobium catenatum TaxID=906689 RepID=A0A2I0VRK4_9ASPA|nr:hexose carrier protein HEX6 [Dendrobium catenatum]PKU66034.1 Hexose carrier protein HEX6 [Dendrobium catenatum]